MGILSIVHACSHLQNAARARLAITSIPNTKFNLSFALALHRAGFLSSIQRGGPLPPGVEAEATEPDPFVEQLLLTDNAFLQQQERTPQISTGDASTPPIPTTATEAALLLHPELAAADAPLTHFTVSTRRLWLGLKYWNDAPVLSRLKPISKPSRGVMLTSPELARIVRGSHNIPPKDSQRRPHSRRRGATQRIEGLTLGECLFLSTDRGVLEAREAVEKRVGGLVLARVS